MSLKAQIYQVTRNKIALGVLLGGVLAFGFVSVLAYQKFFGDGGARQKTSQKISQEQMTVAKDASNKAKKAAAQPSEVQKIKKDLKRQKTIPENKIIGSWFVPLKDGQALLELRGGTYRLIIMPEFGSRWYSNGRYVLKDDLLMLTPNLAWGPPKSKRYEYLILTRGSIPVMVSTYKERLVWQVPSDDMDVYVPASHPFLNLTQDNIAVWDVLK